MSLTKVTYSMVKEAPINPVDFGAVGDGVADDTAAIQAALNAQKPIDWAGLTYRITAPVTLASTADVLWIGRNATIVYDGAQVEAAISISNAAAINYTLNDIAIDGSKLCNTGLKIVSAATMFTTPGPGVLVTNNLSIKRVKRSNAFIGGEALRVVGGFELVELNGGVFEDCELPSGQGTPGAIGITGITVSFDTNTSWVRRCTLSGVEIKKVYSSDLAYQGDQDGIRYFAPNNTNFSGKVQSHLVVDSNCRFINCYGRSVKTQIQDTVIRDSTFTRTEGLTSGQGNTEIDSQTGTLVVDSCTFEYSNGQEPLFCVRTIGNPIGRSGLTATNCTVYVDTGVTLTGFAQFYSNTGYLSNVKLDGIRIFGKTKFLLEMLCNGVKNYAEVSNCWLNELVNGETSEKALVYVKTSGISPYYANLTIRGNYYDNTDAPSVCRTNIGATSMSANVSAWNNFGFIDNVATYVNESGLRTNQAMAIGKITGLEDDQIKGYHQILTKFVAAGATVTFPIRRLWGSSVVLMTASGSGAHAIFASNNSANISISAGSLVAIGNATNPGTGTYNVWSSATNELSVQNAGGSGAPITLFILATA